MTTNAKMQVLRVSAIVALAAFSSAACGQSSEYRRGYEQGYRDGSAAYAPQEHGRPNGRIIIEEARYGSHDGGFCDPREALEHMIGWRRHIDLVASNELCGDPAPHHPKHLEIRYRCGDSPSMRAEEHEGGVIEIRCE